MSKKTPYRGYILIYPSIDEMKLVGPFTSQAKLGAWGKQWQRKNNNDPRWQEMISPTETWAPKTKGVAVVAP